MGNIKAQLVLFLVQKLWTMALRNGESEYIVLVLLHLGFHLKVLLMKYVFIMLRWKGKILKQCINNGNTQIGILFQS